MSILPINPYYSAVQVHETVAAAVDAAADAVPDDAVTIRADNLMTDPLIQALVVRYYQITLDGVFPKYDRPHRLVPNE